jgi:hypothetical protein
MQAPPNIVIVQVLVLGQSASLSHSAPARKQYIWPQVFSRHVVPVGQPPPQSMPIIGHVQRSDPHPGPVSLTLLSVTVLSVTVLSAAVLSVIPSKTVLSMTVLSVIASVAPVSRLPLSTGGGGGASSPHAAMRKSVTSTAEIVRIKASPRSSRCARR